MSGLDLEIDRSGQVIAAEIDKALRETPLYPSVARARGRWGFRLAPMLALATKAKAFDDRLMARVERTARRSLYPLLAGLRAAVAPQTYGRALLDGAAHLAGELDAVDDRARSIVDEFLADPKASRPIGIYAEADDLARIFRHDRLLQTDLRDRAGPVRDALIGSPALTAAYLGHLALIAGLSNPLAIAGVDENARSSAILPASRTLEGDLIKRLFGASSVPDGFELGAELIARIRDGRLDTTPPDDAGWYGHQFHAIAALLAPETPGLQVGPRYHEELAQAFRALFTLNRETHVKQLEIPLAGSAMPRVSIQPELTVEPLPEYYERVASAYRFIGAHLAPFRDRELDGEIDGMARLFASAGATSRAELGRPVEGGELATFSAWFEQIDSDPDLATDIRVAVPVFFDIERGKVRISATIGIDSVPLGLEFATRPAVRAPAGVAPVFQGSRYDILSAVTIECDVDAPPTRERLREICDEYGEPAAIKRALEQLS